ncbi:MAG: nucleotide exchange factor GrpE [Phycisphaerales bacterium]|jgi:molecular chaperone GrpE|nr:nucleotide exchange factor GrpE [Phycisphaerales bacterium]
MTRKKKNKTEPKVDAIDEAVEIPSDAPAAPDAPSDPMSILQAERDDLMARLQRTAADYANYQKRVQREMTESRDFANVKLITELLSILDDMSRALENAGDDRPDDDPLLTGMKMVHDKAVEVLGRFGLESIEAMGLPFDPEMHSALMQQPTDEHPPMTVLQELQRGYKLKGRTIRPAAVIVSSEIPPPQPEETPAQDEPTDDDQQEQ